MGLGCPYWMDMVGCPYHNQWEEWAWGHHYELPVLYIQPICILPEDFLRAQLNADVNANDSMSVSLHVGKWTKATGNSHSGIHIREFPGIYGPWNSRQEFPRILKIFQKCDIFLDSGFHIM